MKRILFLHTGADLYGAGYVFLSLLKALDRTKFFPIVVLPYHGPLVIELEKIGIPSLLMDMPVLRRKFFTPWGMVTFGIGFLKAILYLRQLIVKERLDIVYTNTASTWCSGVAAISMRKKHVWQLMELVEKPLIVSWLMRKNVGWFSTSVFCISDAVRLHFLIGNEGRAGKYKTLYHGVDLVQYDVEKVSGITIRAKLGIDDTTVLVTYAGRISAWKGQDIFAEAASRLITDRLGGLKIHFLILGDVFQGQDQFLIDLEKQLDAIPDRKKYISRFGFQSNLPEWFAASDIFVLPSKLPEPNATVTIGAMAMKLPVIGTNIGGTPETVTEGESGFLIPANDSDALAEKILALAGNREMRISMGLKGYNRVIENFSMQNFCRITQLEFER